MNYLAIFLKKKKSFEKASERKCLCLDSVTNNFWVSILFGMLKRLWKPGAVMARFLMTHNTMKAIISIFRIAYSTFSFLHCDLFKSIQLHQQPAVLVLQLSYLVTEWPISLFSHNLGILIFFFEKIIQLLASYTFHMYSYTYMCLNGCIRMKIILRSYSTEAYFYTEKSLKYMWKYPNWHLT